MRAHAQASNLPDVENWSAEEASMNINLASCLVMHVTARTGMQIVLRGCNVSLAELGCNDVICVLLLSLDINHY